jgi:hypothetical protein
MTFVGLLVFAVFLLAPVVVALGLRRLARDPALRAGAVFAGSATLLYVGIFVVGVFGVQSSTAALGFLVLPFTEAIVFALTLIVGWGGAYLIRRGAHRRALLVPPAVVAVVGFDPDFSGEVLPVQKLFIDTIILDVHDVPGGVDVTLDAQIILLVGPAEG